MSLSASVPVTVATTPLFRIGDGNRQNGQIEDGCEVHQARHLRDVLEDPAEFGILEDDVGRRVDDPAIDVDFAGDTRVRNLDTTGDDPTLVVDGEARSSNRRMTAC